MLEQIKETAENLLERINSPFGGVFVAIWSVTNWRLLFMLFNFDQDCTYNDKVDLIVNYLEVASYCKLLIMPIVYSLTSIIVFQFFSHVTLAITTFFSKWATPAVFFIVDRNKIATKEELTKYKQETFDLQRRFDELQAYYATHTGDHGKTLIALEEAKSELEQLKKVLAEKESQIGHIESKNNVETELITKETQVQSAIKTADDMFPGEWVCSWGFTDGRGGRETFVVKNGIYSYKNKTGRFEPVFFIDDFKYNPNNGTVTFTKRGINDTRISPNVLQIQKEGTLYGKENGNISIKYERKIIQNRPLKIINAIYGTSSNSFDITKELQQLVKDNKLEFVLNNEIGGDPDPSNIKTLALTYEIDGVIDSRTYREGAKVVVSA